MEQMPQVDRPESSTASHRGEALPRFGPVVGERWREGLPELTGPLCTLRELTTEDAESLFHNLTSEQVSRFISPPPTTIRGFQTFVAWSHRQRAGGRYLCYGIVPAGMTRAVGLFQVAFPDRRSATAEWGFVLGSEYWGSGIFLTGARRVLRLAFTVLGVERLEARAVPANGRGNGALRKTGAIKEGILRGSLERFGERFDQFLWVIRRERWALLDATRCSGPRRMTAGGSKVAHFTRRYDPAENRSRSHGISTPAAPLTEIAGGHRFAGGRG